MIKMEPGDSFSPLVVKLFELEFPSIVTRHAMTARQDEVPTPLYCSHSQTTMILEQYK
jgi:hypothetical protein